MDRVHFEWDEEKDKQNQDKHGVPFTLAQYAFADPNRVIAEDVSHSQSERRYYCFGKSGGWDSDSPLHLPQEQNPDHRCGVLAERKGDI